MLQFILFIYVHVINILFIYVHMWLNYLCTLSYLVGYVYDIIAPNDNDEQIKYWLARCVEHKKKLICHQVDDDGFEYPIGSIVVAGTWLRTYLTRRNGLPAFEDYQPEKKILHYSHLVVSMNIKLERYKGRLTSKVLWIVSMEDHEAIIDALQKREDVDCKVGWLQNTHM